jgi:WXXGXW repeat (2 copies)
MRASYRSVLLSACMAVSAASVSPLASAGVNIDVDVAPPPLRVETVPGPRPGYVWAPGYWGYRGHRHEWVPGRYIHERRGRHWVPDRWEPAGPRWHYQPGHWER